MKISPFAPKKIKGSQMPRDLDRPPPSPEPKDNGFFEGVIHTPKNQGAGHLDSIAMTIRALTYDEMMEWDGKLREMMGQPDGPEGIYAALFSRWAKERTMAGLAEGMKGVNNVIEHDEVDTTGEFPEPNGIDPPLGH